MAKPLKILIMKIYNENDKEEKHVFKTMISTTNIVRRWSNMKLVKEVVYEDGEIEDLESTNATEWILKPRGIGKKKKQIQVIVEVLVLVYLGKLITNAV